MHNIPTNILALIFVLSVLIVIHEGGHFAVAKLFKFPVEVFSLGFGKRLFGFKRKETDYRVSLIPLGGYVKVVGLGPDESDVVAGTGGEQAQPGSRGQRLMILFAGPVMNLVLAYALLTVALSLGVKVPRHLYDRPVVKHVDAQSPAQTAGIQVNDEIVKLSGRPVSTWREVEETLALSARQDIPVEVLRGGQPVALSIKPMPLTKEHERYDIGDTGLSPYLAPVIGSLVAGFPGQEAGLKVGDRVVSVAGHAVTDYWDMLRRIREITAGFPPDGARPIEIVVDRGGQTLPFSITPKKADGWKIGFAPQYDLVSRRLSLGQALSAAAEENIRMAKTTFSVVGRLFTGKGSMRQLSGPIDIAKFSGEAARSGASELLSLMAMLSLQLGLLNLLPIPLLDGGQIAVTLLETIARRDFSPKVKYGLLQVGFYFLVAVMVTVLALDVIKNVGN